MRAGVVFLLFLWGQAESARADLAFVVQLVWGTNGSKPADPKLKDIDDRLKERLLKVFKWKNYYEVNRVAIKVPKGGSKQHTLSDKCVIKVFNIDDNTIEVKLFGEGNLVNRITQRVDPKELLVLAGDGKNDTAWFVVLKSK